MNPFRVCTYCGQSVRIVYGDEVRKDLLVFEVHTEKDYVTRCFGSRKLVDAPTVDVEKTPHQPSAPQPTPSQPKPILTSQTVKCPECRKDVSTKRNLRGTKVFVEHYGGTHRCANSLKSVDS